MFLEIKGIKKSFGAGESHVDVLKGIDLEIEKGEFCVLLGPSGSGKSTLLNILGGIDQADDGYIAIDGERTGDMSEKELTLYRRKRDLSNTIFRKSFFFWFYRCICFGLSFYLFSISWINCNYFCFFVIICIYCSS